MNIIPVGMLSGRRPFAIPTPVWRIMISVVYSILPSIKHLSVWCWHFLFGAVLFKTTVNNRSCPFYRRGKYGAEMLTHLLEGERTWVTFFGSLFPEFNVFPLIPLNLLGLVRGGRKLVMNKLWILKIEVNLHTVKWIDVKYTLWCVWTSECSHVTNASVQV